MNNIDILFEDDFLVAFNKPAGLTVNISDTAKDSTLQNYVQDKNFLDESDGVVDLEDEEFVSRSGIVHRLDKATSGVLLVAKNNEAFINLQAQFKGREVKKHYNAFVLGVMQDPIAEVNAPIKRDVKNRMRMSLSVDGKPASTRIERSKVLEIGGQEVTYVDVYPLTGRTHQIRVHLSALNLPVLGDVIYMTRKQYEGMSGTVSRLMLHASKISLKHPFTNEPLVVEAPLPQEFTQLL